LPRIIKVLPPWNCLHSRIFHLLRSRNNNVDTVVITEVLTQMVIVQTAVIVGKRPQDGGGLQ